MNPSRSSRKTLIQSVERALDILETIRASAVPMRAVDIARAIGLSPTAANNILRTLYIRGYLDQNEAGRYGLGSQSYLLGGTADVWAGLRSAAGEAMEELSRRTGHLCFLGVEQGRQIIAVSIAEGSGPVVLPRQQDWKDQFHSTAAGKILLAAMDAKDLAAMRSSAALTKRTDSTITDWTELEADLERVRGSGYAVCRDESVFGISSLGVAVVGSDGRTVAALALAFSSYFLTPDFTTRLVVDLQATAQRIAANLQPAAC
jgi:DNA-binding IclR family transcriptional regulator